MRARSKLVGSLLMAAMGLTSGGFARTPEVQLEELDGRIRIEIDGELFTEYIYAGYDKPLLYPIIGPTGTGMTRNYPMKLGVEGEPTDHPHNSSMWFTHGDINGENFWNHGPDLGRVRQTELIRAVSDGKSAELETKNQWRKADGTVVCTDTRALRFSTTADQRIIDWRVTIHASHPEVVIGDLKEGTMGIRTHPNLSPAGGGRAANSEGASGSEIWGKRAKWVDYWGDIEGKTVGIAIFDHPSNLRHPTWWNARGSGFVAANPFGIHDFESLPAGTGELTIPDGESLTLRYRFVFHEGNPDTAKVDQLFKRFAD